MRKKRKVATRTISQALMTSFKNPLTTPSLVVTQERWNPKVPLFFKSNPLSAFLQGWNSSIALLFVELLLHKVQTTKVVSGCLGVH